MVITDVTKCKFYRTAWNRFAFPTHDSGLSASFFEVC